jgi:hypothetical protein
MSLPEIVHSAGEHENSSSASVSGFKISDRCPLILRPDSALGPTWEVKFGIMFKRRTNGKQEK